MCSLTLGWLSRGASRRGVGRAKLTAPSLLGGLTTSYREAFWAGAGRRPAEGAFLLSDLLPLRFLHYECIVIKEHGYAILSCSMIFFSICFYLHISSLMELLLPRTSLQLPSITSRSEKK